MAPEGHTFAMPHSLQFRHSSCRIWRYRDPFPKDEQPFTHVPQPLHRSVSMVYSN